ncbi:hypothetical protein CBL_02665 [Carabus blaptoides fortunei]
MCATGGGLGAARELAEAVLLAERINSHHAVSHLDPCTTRTCLLVGAGTFLSTVIQRNLTDKRVHVITQTFDGHRQALCRSQRPQQLVKTVYLEAINSPKPGSKKRSIGKCCLLSPCRHNLCTDKTINLSTRQPKQDDIGRPDHRPIPENELERNFCHPFRLVLRIRLRWLLVKVSMVSAPLWKRWSAATMERGFGQGPPTKTGAGNKKGLKLKREQVTMECVVSARYSSKYMTDGATSFALCLPLASSTTTITISNGPKSYDT